MCFLPRLPAQSPSHVCAPHFHTSTLPHRLQVKNLPWAAGEVEIGAFFAAAGPVANVWRGVNPRDGKPHHFTHVQVRTAVERVPTEL